jgi:hypothetical protein
MATHIWPFETGLRFDSRAKLTLAEIYPSQITPDPIPGQPKDAAQVAGIAHHLATLDTRNSLKSLFEGDPALSPRACRAVEREEGWILGATAP